MNFGNEQEREAAFLSTAFPGSARSRSFQLKRTESVRSDILSSRGVGEPGEGPSHTAARLR